MDKPHWNNGFSLIETLLCLMIVFILGSIMITPHPSRSYQIYDFQSQFLHTQYMALLTHTDQIYESEIQTEFPIRFKANGNVTMGQTIQFGERSMVVLLGTGRIYEKSLHDD